MTPGNGVDGTTSDNDGPRTSVARRYLLLGVAGLTAVVVLLGIWITVDVLRLRAALDDARGQADDLAVALKTVGPGGEEAIAGQLARDVVAAHDISTGPIWSLGEHLPFVGGDFRVVSQAIGAVRGAAVEGLPALVQLSQDRDNGTLAVKNGQLDLSTIRQLTPTLERSDAVFTADQKKFAAIDLSAAQGFIKSDLIQFGAKLDQAQQVIRKGAEAARLAPAILGADGARTYLLVFQNNAEIRSTGGIPGAYAVIRANKGVLSIQRQGEGGNLATGVFIPPILRMTKEEEALYGTLPATFWIDSNFTPDFPRTAQILRAMYRNKFGSRLDGVISVDPVALARVLTATGPVQVRKGIDLSAANVISVLLNGVYTRYPHSDVKQNAFFAQAARKIFDTFITGAGSGDPGDLVRQVQASIEESRIIVNLTRPREQALLNGSQLAGQLPIRSGATPQIGLYLNDSTAAKLEFYLRRSSTVQSISCSRAKVQTFRISTSMHSVAPLRVTDLGPGVVGTGLGAVAGHMAMVLTYYAPYGGKVTSISVDGTQRTVNYSYFKGLFLATVPIDLAPGATHTVVATVTSGPRQPDSAVFRTTPGVEVTQNNIVIPTSC